MLRREIQIDSEGEELRREGILLQLRSPNIYHVPGTVLGDRDVKSSVEEAQEFTVHCDAATREDEQVQVADTSAGGSRNTSER